MSARKQGFQHGAVLIELGEDGLFRAELEWLEHPLRDKSLAGVKKKIDTALRMKTRVAASALPAAFVEIDAEWHDGSYKHSVIVTRGTYTALNAHRNSITLKLEDGEEKECEDGWLFRGDDPALEKAITLARAKVAADRAQERAKKAYESFVEEHGYEVSRWAGNRGRTTADAADKEAKILELLTPPETQA